MLRPKRSMAQITSTLNLPRRASLSIWSYFGRCLAALMVSS